MKAHILMNGESQETLFEDIGSQVSLCNRNGHLCHV